MSYVPNLPIPPADFVQSKFLEGVYWHQRWQVFEDVWLPGVNDVDSILERIEFPAELSGKRVLDIGAWNGAFSFECERRGAAEVVAYSLENPADSGFNRLKAVLNSNVKYIIGSVYDLDPAVLGQFDVVLFLGVLYHLRYPLLAIDKLRAVIKGELFVETHVIDHCFLPPGKTLADAIPLGDVNPALLDVPIWQFYPGTELDNDPSNWFGGNIRAVMDGFMSAGFQIRETATWSSRAAFRAQPSKTRAFENTYEGQSSELQRGLGLKFRDGAPS